jgi:hypothetical protein
MTGHIERCRRGESGAYGDVVSDAQATCHRNDLAPGKLKLAPAGALSPRSGQSDCMELDIPNKPTDWAEMSAYSSQGTAAGSRTLTL